MHSMIYFGFLVLLGVTTVLEIDHQMPEDLKFLQGRTYQAYAFVGDAAGVVFVVGVVWAILRRYVQRPYRIRIKTKPEHALILGTFLLIGLSGFASEMFRIAQQLGERREHGLREVELHRLAAQPDSSTASSVSTLHAWHNWMWMLHVVAFIVFLAILPITMLRHMFTSPLNMYLKDRTRPKGAMKPMPNLAETELETFGASVVEDFTWKQLLDTDACTMCGRCTSVCPAHATGKPLDPREIVLKTGEVMAATGSPVVSPPIGTDPEITITAPSLFERITSEEIWACTTCKACDEICPVNIEILDKILDMRRYLSLMESDFPTELGNAYRGMENQYNPWGMSPSERGDWAKGMDDVQIVDPGEQLQAEYLYWVGCAGSFDDKNKRVTQAMAKLLRRAGITVAVLGPSEMCTGDSARRSGNEYLFQMLAMPNIEMLNGMGVRKIITQCPHCFNTLLNEYPQLGGHYEVVHHSQLLEAADRRRPPRRQPGDARGAHHVPRLLLPRPPQRRVPRAAQGRRLDQGHRGRRDAAQRHQGHVLRRRRGAHVDGGVDRHQGQRRAGPGGPLDRGQPHRHRLPVLLHHARRRHEGRRGRRGRQGRRHRHPPARRHRGRRAHVRRPASRPSPRAPSPASSSPFVRIARSTRATSDAGRETLLRPWRSGSAASGCRCRRPAPR